MPDLGNIAAAKEVGPAGYQPLMLVEIFFPTSSLNTPLTLYLCSNGLNLTDGGISYNGNDYLGRIMNDSLSASQALSDTGIDQPSSMSIDIADPDQYIELNYERPDQMGFKGATLTARFVMYDVATGRFTTNSVVRFVGRCNSPQITDSVLTVSAISKLTAQQNQRPSVHLQPTCPWTFPQTSQDRLAASPDDSDSPCRECGYSPDAGTADARGNYQGTTSLSGSILANTTTFTVNPVVGIQPATPFVANLPGDCVIVTGVSGSTWTVVRGAQGATAAPASSGAAITIPYTTCNKTRQDCLTRMGNGTDLLHDKSNRATGRFGGFEWTPVTSYTGRGFIADKWELIVQNPNEAKFNDLVPECYGSTWVEPLVLNVTGDGNYTYMEVLLNYGKVNWVYDVVVNGVRIPHTYNDGVFSSIPNELAGNHEIGGGFWTGTTDGRRNGNTTLGTFYQGQGDCFGSMAVLFIAVPVKLATPSSTPKIQVRLDGASVRVYSTPTTYTRQFSGNPWWVILDLLIRSGWKYSEIDIQSFITQAAIADQQISFTDLTGTVTNTIYGGAGTNTIPYRKYDVSLALRRPRSTADILRGLRNACQGILIQNYANGLLQAGTKSTLAVQQPSPVQLGGANASNYNTPVASVNAAGVSTNGYVAYNFDDSNIARAANGKDSTFRITQRPINSSPNTLVAQFQDFENRLSTDSTQIVDTEDVIRIGQSVPANYPIDGANTYDRVRRALISYQAETYRGNPRNDILGEPIGDTRGTYQCEWETDYRAIHLQLGQIVQLSYAPRSIVNWLMRIIAVQPGRNSERIKITAVYHNDLWYLNSYGQVNRPLYRISAQNTNLPQAWCPNAVKPMAGDSMYVATDATFNMVEKHTVAADGSDIAAISISGQQPENLIPNTPAPPFVAAQGATSNTGGTIPGGITLFARVCPKTVAGANYKCGRPSALMQVVIPAGTSTNTASWTIPMWDPAAPGYVLFAGTSAHLLTYQQDADTTPSSITQTAYNVNSWGCPDVQVTELQVDVHKIRHSGIAGMQVASVQNSSTFTLSVLQNLAYANNALVGYDVSVIALGGSYIPLFNAKITSNTGNQVSIGNGLDGTTPNLTLIPRGDGTTGLAVGDVVVIRSKPTFGTESVNTTYMGLTYWDDPMWVNIGSSPEAALSLLSITSTGSTPGPGITPDPTHTTINTVAVHGYSNGDLVYISGLNRGTGFPNAYTISSVSAHGFNITLDTSAYPTQSNVGQCQRIPQGLAAGAEAGAIARIVSGTGRGQKLVIAGNTATRIWFASNFSVTPDSTSRLVIEEPTSQVKTVVTPVSNDNPFAQVNASPEITNYKNQTVSVTILAVGGNKLESINTQSPYREGYIVGGVGTVLSSTNGLVTNVGVSFP